ncbi:ChbG/HpnK family deacetylase [Roseateles amylovorans]|uniref:ChbG/HpnK family deacetylase n=1 Tax=Roseateles amylovorans TaxID=2978473 RepID=A0ABY6AWU1_9BURK|nr:ChbG/HpnK family deacetylase [Roseateles amylovorans]UXH76234.1 ChbG/HpnK family deacetylase [Roseateles amylovorans]
MTGDRAICIGIDDFGLHGDINAAAMSLMSEGRVHAVSCMVGASAWAEGARCLRRDSAGPIDVGLHLDLTAYPQTLPPSEWRRLWGQGVMGRLDIAALRGEIGAQLDAFERELGRAPDFVDGHQHVHQFPQVRHALIDLLMRRFPYRKPWVRSTRASGWGIKSLTINHLGGRAFISEADTLDLRHNRALLGVYDFTGGPQRYERLLCRWLKSAREGDLLMCHPSRGLIPGDEIAQARVDEYAVLSGSRFDWMVRSRGLHLRPMSRILDDDRWAQAMRRAAGAPGTSVR